MNQPTKYKSISVIDLWSRPVVLLNNTEKQKVFEILSKMIVYIKNKHS